jgi:ArsR family metal-binding transcriptional regulator
LELDNFISKLCRGGDSFEFLPKSKVSLDLKTLSKSLSENNFTLKAETKLVLLANYAGTNISIFQDGKILVKEIKEESKAKELASLILKHINDSFQKV